MSPERQMAAEYRDFFTLNILLRTSYVTRLVVCPCRNVGFEGRKKGDRNVAALRAALLRSA